MTESFASIMKGYYSLTIVVKLPILDVIGGPAYASI